MKNKKLFLIALLALFSSQAYALLDDFNYSQAYTIQAGLDDWDTNQPAARTTFLSKVESIIAETSDANSYMLITDVNIASTVGAHIFLQYSDDNSTWIDANTNSSHTLDIGTVGIKTTGWLPLTDLAKGRKYFRIVGEGGNGLTPSFFTKTMIVFQSNPRNAVDLNSIQTVTINGLHSQTWNNMPVATTELLALEGSRVILDTNNVTHYEFIINRAGGIGFATAKVYVEYSDDNVTWWDMNASATAGTISLVPQNSTLTTDWQTMPAGAIGLKRFFRVVGSGSNGAADPAFNTMIIKFRTNLDNLTDVNISETYSPWSSVGATRMVIRDMPLLPRPLTSVLGGQQSTVFYADATDVNCYKLVFNQFGAGTANPIVNLQYSDDNVTWTDANVGTADTLDLTETGIRGTACYTLTTSAKGLKYFRLNGQKGNGVSDPALFKTMITFVKEIKDNSAPADNTCDDFALNQDWAVKNDCYFTTNVNIGTGIVYIAVNGRIYMDNANLYAKRLNCRIRVGECLNLKNGAKIIFKSN